MAVEAEIIVAVGAVMEVMAGVMEEAVTVAGMAEAGAMVVMVAEEAMEAEVMVMVDMVVEGTVVAEGTVAEDMVVEVMAVEDTAVMEVVTVVMVATVEVTEVTVDMEEATAVEAGVEVEAEAGGICLGGCFPGG